MGSIQSSLNITNQTAFLHGNFKSDDGVYAQDAAETIDVALYTILGQITASGKLVALESDAVDGSQFPIGIINESILAASIVAGDVNVLDIVVGDGVVNQDKIVFRNGTDTLDTMVSGRTLKSYLGDKNFYFKSTTDFEEHENA